MEISKITLGTVQLGLEYGIANKTGKPTLENAFKILDAAINGGISSFDTSAEYGDSEEVLGSYFKSHPEKDPFICTKLKLDSLKDHESSLVEKTIYFFVERSMKRLGINRIPVCLLHNPNDLSRFGRTVPDTFKKLADEGYIVSAGASIYTVQEAEKMMENDIYRAVQLPMNLFDVSFYKKGLLQKMYNEGIDVFVRSVFLQGLFFFHPDTLPSELVPYRDLIVKLNRFCAETGIGIKELAFTLVRDTEGIKSIVVGAETPEQITQTIELSKADGVDKEKKRAVMELFSDVDIKELMNSIRSVKK